MRGETMTMTAKQDDGRPNPGALTLDPADFRHRLDFLKAQATAIRRWTIALSGAASVGHVGAALSSVDLFTGLYFHQLRVNPLLPDWAERDRFILAHAEVAAALYATLGARGFLRAEGLWSRLKTGHAPVGRTLAAAPGVDLCTGSLGYGLAVGAGLALSARRHGVGWRTIVMLSDEECHSSNTWNPARAAAHMKLDHLIAIVSTNGMHVSRRDHGQGMGTLAADWEALGWHVVQTDGHDLVALCGALEQFVHVTGKPGVLIANTVVGKGVSFLEHGLGCHDRPLMPAETAAAIEELA